MAPDNIEAFPGNGEVSLSWDAVTSAVDYNVYRISPQGQITLLTPSAPGLSYTDRTATNGVTYKYVVQTMSVNPGAYSPTITATPSSLLPKAPTSVSVIPGDRWAALSWASSANTSSYAIFRGTSLGGPYSFIGSVTGNSFEETDLTNDTTYYYPHATSLRMGDIGYQNSREEGLGIKACYDDVQQYADSLLEATLRPAESWETLGVRDGDDYRQLNANILQIENEYYSTVRPKQVLDGLEKPSLALKRRGIRYIELRSLDVNAYHPLGIDEVQGRFLEVFMLFCLLADSPLIDACERREIDRNLLDVAHRGREPKLQLSHRGVRLPMRAWALEILESLLPVCEALDAIEGGAWFEDAVDDQINKVRAPDLTPSGRMLDEMRDNGEGFYQFARRLSQQHHRFFTERSLADEKVAALDETVAESLAEHARLEAEPQVDFDRFLTEYFAQTG